MIKKTLYILLALVMLLGQTPGAAIAKTDGSDPESWKAVGYLTDQQTGQTVAIPVSLSGEGDMLVADFAIAAAALTTTVQKTDFYRNNTTRVTLKMMFDSKVCGSDTCYKVERAEVSWSKLNSAVSWQAARVTIHSLGYCETGSGCYNVVDHMNIGTPNSGTWYVNGFTIRDRYIRTNSANYVAAVATMEIKQGTSTWSLTACINKGGDDVFACPLTR